MRPGGGSRPPWSGVVQWASPVPHPLLPAGLGARLPGPGQPLHLTAECVAQLLFPSAWSAFLWATKPVPDPLHRMVGRSGQHLASDRVVAAGHQVLRPSTTLPATPGQLDQSPLTCSTPGSATRTSAGWSGSPPPSR